MKNEKNIIDELLSEIPEFISSYEKIKNEYDVIPIYIVFSELARFFIFNFEKKNEKILEKIQIYLEKLAKMKEKSISELVSFGFLENLAQSENHEEIKKKLRPNQKKELEKIDKFFDV